MIKTKGKKIQARSARTGDSRGRKSSSLRSTGTPPLTLSDGQDASAVPDSDGSSKHSHVEDRALSHPDNLSATSGTGGTIPPARGRNPAARSSQDEVVALHSARFTIEQGCAYQLTERHVRALLKAGDTLPPEVAEKFAALCDEFNPMPG